MKELESLGNTFKIVFFGVIKEGIDPTVAKQRFRKLFKIDKEQTLERLFSGETVVLKRGLSKEGAQTYARAIEKAGADCTIEPDKSVGQFSEPDINYKRHKKRVVADFSSKGLDHLGIEPKV